MAGQTLWGRSSSRSAPSTGGMEVNGCFFGSRMRPGMESGFAVVTTARKGGGRGGAKLTFAVMNTVYKKHARLSFVIESFDPDPGNEIGKIVETMAATTTAAVKAALQTE